MKDCHNSSSAVITHEALRAATGFLMQNAQCEFDDDRASSHAHMDSSVDKREYLPPLNPEDREAVLSAVHTLSTCPSVL